jgi:tetratricopeptide (TPR) repeat protein
MVKRSKVGRRKNKKTQKRSKPVSAKPSHAHAKSSAKRKTMTAGRAAKAAKPARAKKATKPETKKVGTASKPAEAPRLLRETKATTAALGLLARGIKLIYQKEFRKARVELKSLIESYPAEPEILARARTYLQICDREEASHKKPVIGNDQLYTLGVMEHNRGDYEKAVAYFRQSLEKNPNSDHIYYSLAASCAVKGEIAEALRNLQKAVELNEENRVYAKNDSDFAPLHGEKEFSDLVGWSPPAAGGQS